MEKSDLTIFDTLHIFHQMSVLYFGSAGWAEDGDHLVVIWWSSLFFYSGQGEVVMLLRRPLDELASYNKKWKL